MSAHCRHPHVRARAWLTRLTVIALVAVVFTVGATVCDAATLTSACSGNTKITQDSGSGQVTAAATPVAGLFSLVPAPVVRTASSATPLAVPAELPGSAPIPLRV